MRRPTNGTNPGRPVRASGDYRYMIGKEDTMSKILKFSVLVCLLAAANAWGVRSRMISPGPTARWGMVDDPDEWHRYVHYCS